VGRGRRVGLADEEARQLKPSCRKILDHYEEGRITPTGAILRVLEITDQEEMSEAIEVLPPELLERLRDSVKSYRPDMLVFPGPPLEPRAVRMAREVLAETVKPT
jgi:hypothetical protein